MALDRNTSFTFQVHIIQYLILHISAFYRIRIFQQTVCQGTFPMVNMSNNTKIADILHLVLCILNHFCLQIYKKFNYRRAFCPLEHLSVISQKEGFVSS